jgi:N-acetylglucosamine-6-phosphate deacetylase
MRRSMSDGSARFFDLQVNGYGGIDFNQDDLTAEGLHRACERLEADGVIGILATIITDDLNRMARRPRQPRAACARMTRSPSASSSACTSRGRSSAPCRDTAAHHPLDAIRPAKPEEMQRLLDAGGGLVKLVTLAPEQDDGAKVSQLLAAQGIRISAGHTDASLDQLRAALDAGLTLFTHLGNGCPMQMHRHDNIVQRALSLSDRLQIMFIADGTHVPYTALRNYLRLTGTDTTIVVSDAIAPAGLGPGRYTLGRWDLLIGEDMVARAPDGSHFVGSAITMKQAYANLVGPVGLSEEHATRLTRDNPMRAIGITQ